MEPKSKSAFVYCFTSIFICLVALSFMSTSVDAYTQIYYQTPYYDGWARGGSGDRWEATAETSGYVRAYCTGNSNAWALVQADQYYGGGTMTKITIYVTAQNAYVYLDHGPWWSYAGAEAKWWVKFIDATIGSVLYEDKTVNYVVTEGFSYYQKSFTKSVVGGHTYRVEAGVYCTTGKGWTGNWGTAEARGTIIVMQVVGDP